jgi:ribosomal protein S18 acetylase RimI-like enzyme
MAEIRKLRKGEIYPVEYICRMTAGEFAKKEPIVGNRMAKMYSTYYARECYDTCFVLVDDSDKPVGYILCEPDYKRYRRVFRKKDVPAIREINFSCGVESWFFPVPYTLLGRKYPAHLHIDILPDYQSKGYGQEMIKTLLNKLKEMNIPGVMLITNRDNTGAIRFYERLGFKTILAIGAPVIMAKNLTE